MKYRLLAAAMVLAIGGRGPALAQTADQVLAFLDKNGDGKCDLNEYLTYQVTKLAQFDANGDGVLQYGEFKESLRGQSKQNAQRIFNSFNNEEDKKALTRREFLGYHAYVFKTYVDTDEDGFMSADEWSKLMASVS